MRRLPVWFSCLALAAGACVSAAAQTPAKRPTMQEGGAARAAVAESRATRAFQEAVAGGPLTLRAFLDQFPKGADLHVHLSGAVYAETFIKDAGEDGLCVDPKALDFAQPPCTAPLVAAKELSGVLTPAEQDLYDELVDAFSMRSFVPVKSFSGHDQFFSTFGRFHGLSDTHTGEWVDEVASRAADQNQQYLELMETPPFGRAIALGHAHPLEMDFAKYRETLLAAELRDDVAADLADAKSAEAKRKEMERCGTAEAAPACAVTVRYLDQVLRGNAPEQVFAQTLLGFETVKAAMEAKDDTWVGINFVMPEDGYVSMRDYKLQMKMLDYLHGVYPEVRISLHAGELAPGLVPPEGLRFHIRQAVELGHAERIGHGVDVMEETDAQGLLKEMAQRHVMVEINLSSNEGILGVKGEEHPFPVYREAHVPVALSTDDEGVSRIDLTHEYVRAVMDYHLGYADIKQMARTGIEHSFLSGDDLWAAEDVYTAVAAPCRGQALGGDTMSPACKTFLDGSEKAAAEWELERRFRAFEAKF